MFGFSFFYLLCIVVDFNMLLFLLCDGNGMLCVFVLFLFMVVFVLVWEVCIGCVCEFIYDGELVFVWVVFDFVILEYFIVIMLDSLWI